MAKVNITDYILEGLFNIAYIWAKDSEEEKAIAPEVYKCNRKAYDWLIKFIDKNQVKKPCLNSLIESMHIKYTKKEKK